MIDLQARTSALISPTSLASTVLLDLSSFEATDQPFPFDFGVREIEDKRDANTATLISSTSLVRVNKVVFVLGY